MPKTNIKTLQITNFVNDIRDDFNWISEQLEYNTSIVYTAVKLMCKYTQVVSTRVLRTIVIYHNQDQINSFELRFVNKKSCYKQTVDTLNYYIYYKLYNFIDIVY